jgi:Flp pilus assembly pilin Flp
MLITYVRALLGQLAREEEGQTAIEYALVLALIAVVIVGAVASGLLAAVPTIITQVTNAL